MKTDEELLDDLRVGSEALGHPPSSMEYRKAGEYSHMTYYKRFGSWPDALEAAGLDPEKAPQEHEKVEADQVISDIQELANKLDTTPSLTEFIESVGYSQRVVRERFGTFTDLLVEAGLI